MSVKPGRHPDPGTLADPGGTPAPPGSSLDPGTPADPAVLRTAAGVQRQGRVAALPETTPADLSEPFEGVLNDAVLAMTFEDEPMFVRDLVPRGAVGTIAGVPETHKSFLAQALATAIAKGEGDVLGRPIVSKGRVGYFWQDDSTRAEAERVQLYADVHEPPAGLPLFWFLNPGLELPRDLTRLRATVETLQLDLLVIDSFYNVAPSVGLRDAEAEQIVASLKREIADATGCTVLIVDHMPWANETNRGRLRAYGGVFKNAATRFGIYVDADKGKLYVEARGNNIGGFGRTAARWDADSLTLALVDSAADSEPAPGFRPTWYMAQVSIFVEGCPKASRTSVRTAVGKSREYVDLALDLLTGEGYLEETKGPRGAREVTSIKPYREASDPLADRSTSSPTSSPAHGDAKNSLDDPVEKARRFVVTATNEGHEWDSIWPKLKAQLESGGVEVSKELRDELLLLTEPNLEEAS